MPGPHPAVALTRRACRLALHDAPGDMVFAAVSGGADSLALAAALLFEAPKLGMTPGVIIVDHGLFDGSDEVARQAAQVCEALGFLPENVVARRVVVDAESSSGSEAAARVARYDALEEVASAHNGAVFLGHTGDDQAEQVLLGLLRGSGARALAGMPLRRDRFVRPFLAGPPELRGAPVMREHTRAACEALGLMPWSDPANSDEQFARVRMRHLLRNFDEAFPQAHLNRALTRTASSLRRDTDLLERLTDEALADLPPPGEVNGARSWPVKNLADLDPALRIRVLHRLLIEQGARASELASHHLYEVENLITSWHGQRAIPVPGSVKVRRVQESLIFERTGEDDDPLIQQHKSSGSSQCEGKHHGLTPYGQRP